MLPTDPIWNRVLTSIIQLVMLGTTIALYRIMWMSERQDPFLFPTRTRTRRVQGPRRHRRTGRAQADAQAQTRPRIANVPLVQVRPYRDTHKSKTR